MSLKKARKIGFISALAMLIGTVVGIGIFFKNDSVMKATDGDGVSALLAWIVGGLLALFAALSFSDIGAKIKTGSAPGLPGWAEKVGGKKFGYFVRFNFTFMYYAILTPIIGFFVSELFFKFLVVASDGSIEMPHVWVHALFALLILIISLSTNLLSIRYSGFVQTATTAIKFIPLVLALIIGIVLPNTHHDEGSNHFSNINFTFTGMLAALPGILFAYDAFLGVAALPSKTKGGEKTVSKAVFFGLITVIILYSLISVSAMLHKGSIGGILTDSLPQEVAKGVGIAVYGFLFVSGYGVSNGISAAMVAYAEMDNELKMTPLAYNANKVSAKNGKYILTVVAVIFGYLAAVIPAVALDSDSYVDTFSNFPTLFFFVIYALVVGLYIKKFANKISTLKKVIGIAFVVGTLFVAGYQLFYGFTIRLFISGEFTTKNSTGVGLFAPSSKWTDLYFFITFICYLFLFMALPYINKFVMKKRYHKDVIIDTLKA